MPLDTDFNVSPYYDDYDETKNFHRILFKPAVAVQARELTQLQTILQNQIERFGSFMFKDGTVIKGVSQRYKPVKHVKLRDNVANGNLLLIENMIVSNTYLKGQTSGVLAEIIQVADGAEVTAPNFKTVFVNYIESGSDNTTKEFANNEVVQLVNQETRVAITGTDGQPVTANTLSADFGGATGNSYMFTVEDGIVYQKGHFIRVGAQKKIISKYSQFPTTQVGFDIDETAITSFADDSLADNSIGSSNYQAPGADRLKLTPTLVTRSAADTANAEPFFPIAEFRAGILIKQAPIAQLDELGNKLAQRTYEESGDYILQPFNIRLQEHLNTTTNYGVFKSDGSDRGVVGDRNKLVATVEGGGVAYVRGYRNEILQGIPVELDKGLDVVEQNAQALTTSYGNYVNVDQVCGRWSQANTGGVTVELHDTAYKAVTSGQFSNTNATGTKLGTAKFLAQQYKSGSKEDGSGAAQYKIFLYDVEMNSGQSFEDVRSLYVSGSTGVARNKHSFADVILNSGAARLQETNKSKLIFNFGSKAIKRLRDSGGSNDTQYTFRQTTNFTLTSGSTSAVISKATGFDEIDQPETITGATSDFIFNINDAIRTKELLKANWTSGSNTVSYHSGNTPSSVLQVGDFVQLDASAGGSNNGVFKIHSVDGSSITLTGQTTGAATSNQGEVRKYYYPGAFLDVGRSGSSGSRSLTFTGSAITLNHQEDFETDVSATVSYSILKTEVDEKNKIVRRNRFVGVDLNTSDGGVNGPWSLGISDVFKIKAIYKGSNYSVNNEDVTTHFTLDSGMKDTHYENSSLKLKPTSTLSLSASDKLTVKLDYFEHDTTDGVAFFSVDSYNIDDTTSDSSANTINTAEIPVYKSPTTGSKYDLRDHVDFRPRFVNQTVGVTDVSSIVTINSANTQLDYSSFGNYTPAVDTNVVADLEYYLPRRDKIVLDKEGMLYVTKGVSSLNPKLPRDQGDAITLADVFIPPYPSLAPGSAQLFNRPEYQTKLNLKTYKRYTMRDIGRIEERIGRIEYYSALNLLEQSARDIKELDGSGIDRFKNGFFADPFIGHQLGDTTDDDYAIAIDSKKGEARPKFTKKLIELEYDSTNSTGVVDRPNDVAVNLNSGVTTTDLYNFIVAEINAGRTVVIYQGSSLASATAKGTVVSYFNDSTSTRRLFVEQIDGTSSSVGKFAAGAVKTSDNQYSGTIDSTITPDQAELITLPYTHTELVKQPFASKLRNPTGEISFNWAGKVDLFPAVDTWKSEEVLPDVTIELDLYENFNILAQAFDTQYGDWVDLPDEVNTVQETSNPFTEGTGIFENVTSTTTTVTNSQRSATTLQARPVVSEYSFGEVVKDISVVPYMRSRIIKFRGHGMRPNTRVYPFFDDINVAEYVQPTDRAFANTGNFNSSLVTSSVGEVFGRFRIPNDESLKFTVGTKRFRLTDVQDLITASDTITTSAGADYTASGLELSKQGLGVTTRTAELFQSTVTETKSTTTTDVTTQRVQTGTTPPEPADNIPRFPIFQNPFQGLSGLFDDPIAQSFKMPDNGSAFITKIDIFFKQKDENYGCDVQIREMENGTITQKIVPFGITTLNSADISVSDDATIPTSFKFNTPVYLANGKEYAFVVYPHGGAPRYRLWTAELGGRDVTTAKLITAQPAIGVMFTSSNDTTYNAFQSEDIKFTIYRANYTKNVTGTVQLQNTLFDNFAFRNKTGSFLTGEKVRGSTRIKIADIGNGSIGQTSSNSTLGSSISVNDQVRGLTTGSVGLVRYILSQTANTVEVLVDNANTFSAGEILKVTRVGSANTNDVVFGLANTTGGQQNNSLVTVQVTNNQKQYMIGNTSTGDFTSNTNSFNGWARGVESNATMQIVDVSDIKVDVITPRLSYIDYGNTSISFTNQISDNTASYTLGSYTPVVVGGINEYLTEKAIGSESNAGKRTYKVKATMLTGNPQLSPVIDLRKNMSAIAVQNIINEPYPDGGTPSIAKLEVGETSEGGNSAVRYISKPITLADGQDAEDLKVYTTAYKPSVANVAVFVRFLAGDDPEPLGNKSFTMLTQITPANVVSSSTNQNDFNEYVYGLPSGANAAGNSTAQSAYLFTGNNNVIRYHDDGGASYDTFKTFQIKVVMTGSDSAIVPRLTDLRAIALQK